MKSKVVVQKYGGTSVGSPEKIQRIAKRIIQRKKKGDKIVVVVSAMADTTDELEGLAEKISANPPEREMDMLLSTGEQISIALLAMAIHSLGEDAISFTGSQVGIVTSKDHTKARIQNIDCRRVKKALANNQVVIVAGFQGRTDDNEITTLGRGGSDLTAVALATALKADLCEIYTDVDGIYTTDPRIEPRAKKLKTISYDEILEMSSLGAQVMYSRSIEVGKKYNVPILVRSSLNQNAGTLITKENPKMEKVLVSGVTLNEKEAKITVFGVPDKPGVASKLFKKLADGDFNIDMIIQNMTGDKTTDISFTVFKKDLKRVTPVVKKIAKAIKAEGVTFDEKIAKVSISGIGMRSHSGVASSMFDALAKKKINIEMISTSEIKISVIVEQSKGKAALRALHSAFKLHLVK
jgi:aspartate kinase